MNRLVSPFILLFILVSACSSSGDGGGGSPDGGAGGSGSGGGQHVIECRGTVQSNQPSNCPHGDCDNSGGDRCDAYASYVPGASTGLCNAGETGTYGLVFDDGTLHPFYEVIQCTAGTPQQHPCASGFSTVASGYDGQPGYHCL